VDAYSLENARKYQWSSVTGDLNVERIAHLDRYLLGDMVLDAGCAGGAYSEYLRSKGFKVTGIDKAIEFLATIPDDRQKFYQQADIENLPFADKYFDSTYVLEHVDDISALKELIRVTKHRLIIAVPHKNHALLQDCSLMLMTYQDSTHLRYYSSESLKNLIESVTDAPFKIFGELRVPTRYLCSELVKGKPRNFFESATRRLAAFLVKGILYLTKKSDLDLPSSLVAIVDL
jgi:SAM-dependent methyltransferase